MLTGILWFYVKSYRWPSNEFLKMAQRRSRRTAAAAAESRIARAVEDESEDSNGSTYGADNNSVSSSDDEANATIEEESDTEFIPEAEEKSSKSSKSKANKKGSKSKAPASKKSQKSTTSSSSTTANPVNSSSNASVTSKDNDSSDKAKELSDDSLKCLIRNFRLTDLQALMIYVGKNKAGRKNEMLVCSIVFLSRLRPSGPANYSSYFCIVPLIPDLKIVEYFWGVHFVFN